MNLRQLHRAMLDRQLLLHRVDLPVVTAVERLLGLNAQDPNIHYLALWNRLERFAIADLTAAIEDRTLVRSTLMRGTQHVMTVADFRLVRPLIAPQLRRMRQSTFGTRTNGVDLDAVVARTRELLADGTVLTRPDLGRLLARDWPGIEPGALGWTAQYLYPVVHPAPSGTWNIRGATPFACAGWTGVQDAPVDARELVRRYLAAFGPASVADARAWSGVQDAPVDARELVRRYLAAFGPASVADARAWSGVSGLREVFTELRPELTMYRDESGRELFDLPDMALPDPDVPAPVRFLPAFDAPLLAYADRTRVMTDEIRRRVCVGSGVAATVLVDGTVAAEWSMSTERSLRSDRQHLDGKAVLAITPFRTLPDDVGAEAERVLAFAYPNAVTREVRL